VEENVDSTLNFTPRTKELNRFSQGVQKFSFANSPTVAHACSKRRLKWVLPQVGGWITGLATLSL